MKGFLTEEKGVLLFSLRKKGMLCIFLVKRASALTVLDEPEQ